MLKRYGSFSYAGHSSDEFGVKSIRIESGLLEDTFMYTTKLTYSLPKHRNKVSIFNTDKEPITFPIQIYFEDEIDEQGLRAAKNWLDQDYFKELFFHDEPDRICYAMLSGDSQINYNHNNEGYITAVMLTNSPYYYGRVQEVKGVSKPELSTIHLNNDSDILTPCMIKVKAKSATDVKITNITSSQALSLSNLPSNVTVEMDSAYESIETSSADWFGYDDHNDVFIHLAPGENEIQFKGNFDYQVIFQPIYL